MALDVRDLWRSIPPAGHRISEKERRPGEFLYGMERACTLALLELFGLMAVEREVPEEGQSWRVAEVHHTPFGDAILGIVLEQIAREIFTGERCAGDFGAWQTSLRPYFPQWVNNLELPVPEFRDGVYYFKVSLGKPSRRIAISAEATLDDFAAGIIRAFDFDGDHLYAFNLAGRDGRQLRVVHPYVEDAEEHTDAVAIGDLPLDARQSMEFQYDFGTDWRFEVILEKIEPEGAKTSAPTIIESRGEAPAEYDFDDEW
jgi:hypothetical protein